MPIFFRVNMGLISWSFPFSRLPRKSHAKERHFLRFLSLQTGSSFWAGLPFSFSRKYIHAPFSARGKWLRFVSTERRKFKEKEPLTCRSVPSIYTLWGHGLRFHFSSFEGRRRNVSVLTRSFSKTIFGQMRSPIFLPAHPKKLQGDHAIRVDSQQTRSSCK